jgi:hypothetical protein
MERQTDNKRWRLGTRPLFCWCNTRARHPPSKDSANPKIKLYLQIHAALGIATSEPSNSALALDEL